MQLCSTGPAMAPIIETSNKAARLFSSRSGANQMSGSTVNA